MSGRPEGLALVAEVPQVDVTQERNASRGWAV
jgi:hypothetical protein